MIRPARTSNACVDGEPSGIIGSSAIIGTAARSMVALAMGLALHACRGEPEGRFAQEADPIVEAQHSALRFGPTVAAATKAGEIVLPLLELATANARRVDIVVAVHRDGSPEIAIELWTFEQPDAIHALVRVGEPASLLRTRHGAPSAEALQPLRRRMAAPGSTLARQLGITADTPEAALLAMGAAARSVRDIDATPTARLDALAKVFAGLDEGMIFERDALGLALDLLASDAWQPRGTATASDRRVRVQTEGGDTLELLRKGDGWVIAAVDQK